MKATMNKKTVSKKPAMKKYQDGGILTPEGRLKSRKTRSVSLDSRGDSASVSKTDRNGNTITRSVHTAHGYAGTNARKTKEVVDKNNKVVSKTEKRISPKAADRKVTRVIKNVGRNTDDTYSYKTGGVKKSTTRKKK